jgi:hypothetical protein
MNDALLESFLFYFSSPFCRQRSIQLKIAVRSRSSDEKKKEEGKAIDFVCVCVAKLEKGGTLFLIFFLLLCSSAS